MREAVCVRGGARGGLLLLSPPPPPGASPSVGTPPPPVQSTHGEYAPCWEGFPRGGGGGPPPLVGFTVIPHGMGLECRTG